MERALSIYQRALELGFDDCRIARSRALSEQRERLSEWLSSGRYGGLNYMLRNFDKRLDPGLLVEGTRSVIVCAIGYKRPPVTHPLLTHIASYAWGKDYHLVIREKLKSLLQSIQTAYPGSSGRVFVDTAPLLEKAWAVEAGLGWIGRNSLLIHPVLGSYLHLGIILTDVELQPDTPVSGGCGTCRRCLDACPTGALGEDRMVDARRCIARRTIEKGSPDEEGELHGWIFGCDVCQRCCPYNRQAPESQHPELAPFPDLFNLTPQEWLTMDETNFQTRFHDSPLARCGLQRLQHRIRTYLYPSESSLENQPNEPILPHLER